MGEDGKVAKIGMTPWGHLAALSIIVLYVLILAAPSLAQQGPAWRIMTDAIPTRIPAGGNGLLQVQLENIGDAPSVAGSPITIVDQLPSGLVATRADALRPESLELEPNGLWGECRIMEEGRLASRGRTVTCTYQAGATIPPVSSMPMTQAVGLHLFAPKVGIEVSVEPNTLGTLDNSVSVAGGGASKEASDRAKISVDPSQIPFEVSDFGQWSTNINGMPAIQAGSHPFETTTSITFGVSRNGAAVGGVSRNLEVELPSGFVGNPSAAPKCSRASFDDRLSESLNVNCPSDTQIGVALVYLESEFYAQLPIYNLVPPANVPVQFGIGYARFVAFLDASLRPGAEGSYNAITVAHDIHTNGFVGAIVSFWGNPAKSAHDALRVYPGETEPGVRPGPNGERIPSPPIPSDVRTPRPFLSLPTSCGVPQVLSVSAVSWEDPMVVSFAGAASTDEQGNAVVMGGCSRLDFSPSFEMDAGTVIAEKPVGLSVGVGLPQNEDPEGLREADLKDVNVTLPEGTTVSPSAANGLETCSEEQFGVSGRGSSLLFNENPVACPAASKIGTVEITTPLLENPLHGALYLAKQEANPFNSLVALYLVAEGSGVLVKRAGEVHLNQQTGQISVTFLNNPQVPLSEIKVDTFQNPQSSVMTPSHCGMYASATYLTAWNKSFASPMVQPFSITEGCSQGFNPAFTAGTIDNGGGVFSPFSVTFSRQDGEQRIGDGSVLAPPGLSAVLRGVQQCPEPQASNGTCGPESQIGHATVAVGPGPEPFYAPGNVFLTGPYGGAPFGLSIVARAKAGPFDLGIVIVRARVNVDPHTTQIIVTPDGSGPYVIPTILKGIPLDLRMANVTIDRSGFTFNPTNCSRLAVGGVMTSTSGTNVAVSSPFQDTGCAKLPFKPGFTVSTQAKTSKADGASLTVKITKKAGEANLHKVDLQLPIALPARLTTLQKACTEKQFNANPAGCPAGSVIGTAKLTTPVLNVPVTGPAILVSHGGAAFPDVEFVLQGEGITVIVDGATDIKKGIAYSKFETAPDQPFTSFETRLPEGPYSVLATDIPAKAKNSLCGQALTMPTTLVGQNEATLTQATKISVTDCPKAKAKTLTRRKQAKPTRRTK